MRGEKPWWKAAKGTVHTHAFNTVRQIEQAQGDVFDRFVKLESLYDPNTPDGDGEVGHVQENVIATGVDTVAAIVSTADIRARFMTDGADWAARRRARELEFYSEEIKIDLRILPKCRTAFKEGVKKGVGLTKSSIVFDAVRVEVVMVENVVVDQNESRDGRQPKQFHQWDSVDADELTARYPKHAQVIERARGTRSDWGRISGQYGQPDNEVTVLYSWRLPIGRRGVKGYIAGRETVTIDGKDLDDREYHDEQFPFGVFVWSERAKSWYGISGAERIMGIQYALNKRNWQIERTLDQNAVLTTYVRPADANMTVKTHRIGALAVCKGDFPVTPNPPIVSAETYQDRIVLRQSGIQELGVNEMAARASKPAGIDSGVAIRELHDRTTERFAPQEQGFEQLVLDSIWNALMCCKKLGKKAPKLMRQSRFGPREIRWKDVDPREVKIQIQAASNLNRTPAGRVQAVIEYAQAGIVSQDEARELLQHPDLEAALSRYTASLDSVEHDLDVIADGHYVTPEPFQNMSMCVWRGQMEYLKWRDQGAPVDVLEVLRQYIEIAAGKVAGPEVVANDNAAMPAAAVDPMAPAMGAPVGPQPVAALAPQAMELMGS